jgi:hypothetical protein
VDNTRKNANREVFEGSDMIALRLRAAKKPAVIPFLEIPPEEIEVEPITLDPVDLTEIELVAIAPLTVPMTDILPYDDDIQEITDIRVVEQPTKKSSGKTLSLFGVGEIDPKAKK